jgi:hypothetical protein
MVRAARWKEPLMPSEWGLVSKTGGFRDERRDLEMLKKPSEPNHKVIVKTQYNHTE